MRVAFFTKEVLFLRINKDEFMDMKRTVIPFSFHVPASGKSELTYNMKTQASLEKVTVRIYPGAVLNLHLDPYVLTPKGTRIDIFDYVGKKYLDGDNELKPYSVNIPLDVDDMLVVGYENLDAVNGYDFSIDFEVDFWRGALRSDAK